jgi:hypothetical protein
MILFQWIGIPLLALLVGLTLAAALRRQLTWSAATAWACLWAAAATAIAVPDATMWLAHRLGITRGADLVFYCAILSMFGGFFIVFIRFRRMEQQLTRIVRALAIRDAADSDQGPPRT